MSKASGSLYSKALCRTICERISNGESLRSICADNGMPSYPAVMKWLADKPEFAALYSTAKQVMADSQFEELAELEKECATGNLSPQVLRAVVDSRKWRLARMHPKKYGDKTEAGITKTDPGHILAERLKKLEGER